MSLFSEVCTIFLDCNVLWENVLCFPRRLPLTISSLQEIMRPGSEVCVSWDFDAAGGQGNWTRVGCKTQKTDDPNIIRCICNHLTNFAVLVVSV